MMARLGIRRSSLSLPLWRTILPILLGALPLPGTTWVFGVHDEEDGHHSLDLREVFKYHHHHRGQKGNLGDVGTEKPSPLEKPEDSLGFLGSPTGASVVPEGAPEFSPPTLSMLGRGDRGASTGPDSELPPREEEQEQAEQPPSSPRKEPKVSLEVQSSLQSSTGTDRAGMETPALTFAPPKSPLQGRGQIINWRGDIQNWTYFLVGLVGFMIGLLLTYCCFQFKESEKKIHDLEALVRQLEQHAEGGDIGKLRETIHIHKHVVRSHHGTPASSAQPSART